MELSLAFVIVLVRVVVPQERVVAATVERRLRSSGFVVHCVAEGPADLAGLARLVVGEAGAMIAGSAHRAALNAGPEE